MIIIAIIVVLFMPKGYKQTIVARYTSVTPSKEGASIIYFAIKGVTINFAGCSD